MDTKPSPKQERTQQTLPRNHPDRIRIGFDDHRLVANAGLILPSTLALHLGLPQLVRNHLDLGDAPGRANTGGTAWALGCAVKAPSILGTFLRSFRWGHARQLDRVSRRLLARGLVPDHRPGLDHLRDLQTGQGGRPPPRLHRRPVLSPAAGHCGQLPAGDGRASHVIKLGGVTDAAGVVDLSVGGNVITVKVTAEDGQTTQTYTVTVTRAAPASTDAGLSALTLSGVDFGTFDSTTTSYTAQVSNSVTRLR